MWKFEGLSSDEYSQMKDNLLSDLVKKLNMQNKEAFMTLPHHLLFVDNLKKTTRFKRSLC